MSLTKRLRSLDIRTSAKWLILSIMVGVAAGGGAILFKGLTNAVGLSLAHFAGYAPEEPLGDHNYMPQVDRPLQPWIVVGVMAAGGLVSGWMVFTLAPEAAGSGTDSAIDSFHNRRGRVDARVPFVKALASAITLGTGGSAGQEGPIAQIASGFGSVLARRFHLSVRDRRIMLAAGMGAGVGAIFRAPLAGALFAAEIFYSDSDFEADVIIPAAGASIIGYSVFCLSLPEELRYVPLFGSELSHVPASVHQLIPYTLLAFVLVLVAILYIKTFGWAGKLFGRLPTPPHIKPAIGATSAGVIGVSLFLLLGRDVRILAVLGTGYGTLQAALYSVSSVGIPILLTVALVKIVTTALTISSGGAGGVFGPSMVIGGCLGAAVGQTFHLYQPEWVPNPEAFAIVGMAGFFAGCARAPFSTIIMVSELTGGYALLLPAMWVSTLCFLLGRPWSLYSKQVPSRLESPAHRGDFLVDVLEGMHVEDVYDRNRTVVDVHEATSLEDIVHILAETQQHYFPVVDDSGRLVGIFSADDVRTYLYDETIWSLAVARDVMTSRVVSVTPLDDLNTALRCFTAIAIDELPVVDAEDRGKLLGTLRHKETIAFYNRRLMEYKQDVEEPPQ